MAPCVPWASRGLGTRDPVFHLELEPFSSTEDSRAWNWKHRQSWTGQKLDAGLKEIPLLFSLYQSLWFGPTYSIVIKKSFFIFNSGVVRTQTFTFEARVRQSSGGPVRDLVLKLLSGARAGHPRTAKGRQQMCPSGACPLQFTSALHSGYLLPSGHSCSSLNHAFIK